MLHELSFVMSFLISSIENCSQTGYLFTQCRSNVKSYWYLNFDSKQMEVTNFHIWLLHKNSMRSQGI